MNFISSALAGTESPALNPDRQRSTDSPAELSGDRQGGPTGGERMSDADKRHAIDRAQRSMERAFLSWHFTGCMTAAAAYTEARSVWERMLMMWGRVA